jgi:N-acetylmuramoyl-L-alanine amidase
MINIETETNKILGICIVIDTEHGGSGGGTASNGVCENDINLSVALRTKGERTTNHKCAFPFDC